MVFVGCLEEFKVVGIDSLGVGICTAEPGELHAAPSHEVLGVGLWLITFKKVRGVLNLGWDRRCQLTFPTSLLSVNNPVDCCRANCIPSTYNTRANKTELGGVIGEELYKYVIGACIL